MSDQIFERLAEALDRLPNGFPRTSSNVEIKLLKKIFSPEEALLASQLSRSMESVDAIAKRAKHPVREVETELIKMAERGLLWFQKGNGKRARFRLAPFIVGIFESQKKSMDHEFAHLFEDYMANGGAVGIMKPQPALHRVIPAQKAVKSERILPYDDVRAILLRSKSFHLRDCICRVQQDQIGRKCDFPLRTCLSFSSIEGQLGHDEISKDEALAFLDKAEEMGLVHTVSNVMKDFGYVCNCCGCCCGILRGITDWGIETLLHAVTTMQQSIPTNAWIVERVERDVKCTLSPKATGSRLSIEGSASDVVYALQDVRMGQQNSKRNRKEKSSLLQ